MNSTHKVEIVPVRLQPHPNADKLAIVEVFGYTVCVDKTQWQDGALGAYIPPDSIVDSARPEFAWLAGHERIRVKRLRGVVSMGLLVPAPSGMALGEDAAEALGVTHYNPPDPAHTGGEAGKPPSGYAPCYDVENARRFAHVFDPGEPVWVTEKLHGASARYVCRDGAMFCGSRTEWKREAESVAWWRVLRETPELEAFCREHPGLVVYGELYGQVQDLKYGVAGGARFACFDILDGSRWLDPAEARDVGASLPFVPIIADGVPWEFKSVAALAEGPSLVPGAAHVREGCVVKPMRERTHLEVGRVNLKIVGNGYLERA
jgi:RNA ligase (TIGR02306 family)